MLNLHAQGANKSREVPKKERFVIGVVMRGEHRTGRVNFAFRNKVPFASRGSNYLACVCDAEREFE
jgi:hypothetical protein